MQDQPVQDAKAREAYVRALLEELDKDVRARALSRAQVITRSMKPAEKEEYLHSRAFESTVSQTRKKDRVYQAVASGELSDGYEAEYKSLRPLIEQELKSHHPVHLGFLRSVRRSRRPLRAVRQAVRCLAEEQPAAWLRKNTNRLAEALDPFLAEYLRSGDLSSFRDENEKNISVSESVIRGFRQGIPLKLADLAVPQHSLRQFLQEEVYVAFPVLRACAELRLESGAVVSSEVREYAHRARGGVLRALSAHFPQKRLRRLLSKNPSLRDLQRRKDQQRSSQKNLQAALLKAMPEEIRDLYPLARRMRRRFILHLGPTNSGKTWESIQRLRAARCGIYHGPLRLLAFEQFETLNMEDVPCSLVTGEEQIPVEGSRVQSSTVEMADLQKEYDVAVIDECQMISDRDRGGAWSAAILGLCAQEIHLCASPDAERLLIAIIEDCGDEFTVVRHERMAPLAVEEGGFHFPSGVRKGDALIVFSRMRVHALAAELKQRGFSVSLIYGALPPDVRRNQAERFRRGETEVVVSTDAIAMGMNLPIARIVFMESEKYDGDVTRPLTDSEIRQIAGRAGRYGQYDIGYVNAFGFKPVIAQALSRPMLPLSQAVIRFPESLLGLPLRLTEIIDRWISMKDRSVFTKGSTARMAALAAHMETRNTDKRLLYDFICIPFDETDPFLLDEWKTMYRAEAAREHYDVMAVLPPFLDPEQCTVAMLDGLEENYRLCDLYYNYARRFLEDPDQILAAIQQRKDLISSGIIHVLSTQKLPGRKCRQCGRSLPWDWPYAICDRCWRYSFPGR